MSVTELWELGLAVWEVPEPCWLGEPLDCELEGVDWPWSLEAFVGCALSFGPEGIIALVNGRQ